jgi:hypothetical protein
MKLKKDYTVAGYQLRKGNEVHLCEVDYAMIHGTLLTCKSTSEDGNSVSFCVGMEIPNTTVLKWSEQIQDIFKGVKKACGVK